MNVTERNKIKAIQDWKCRSRTIREAEEKKNIITVADKNYDVHPDVIKLLDGGGVNYFDGEEKVGKNGSTIFVTLIKILKRSDVNFEASFVNLYDTIAGELLLRDGVDIEGINPTLEQLK